MKLDRALQKSILLCLQEKYPVEGYLYEKDFNCDFQQLNGNVAYLCEHGLLTGDKPVYNPKDGPNPFCLSKITAKGLDFIAKDGGLSEILGVITVKFDIDNIREIISARIDASHASEEEKESLKKQLKMLPAKILEMKILEWTNIGISRIPDICTWLQTLVHH